jgi:hypothetical protein
MIHPLTTLEIYKEFKSDDYSKNIFKAVVPKDKLSFKVTYPSAYVINTDNSTGPGEHWLAVYYKSDKTAVFFDSFGLAPQFYGLDNYMRKTSISYSYNQQQLQGIMSSTCGYYCVLFILLVCRNLDLQCILDLFNKKDVDLNDFKISFIMNKL